MPQPAGKKPWTPQRIVQMLRWSAVVVTLAGVLWSASTALFIVRAETTEATVVEWDVVVSKSRSKTNGMSEEHSFWHAIVELQDEHGTVHRARSPRGLNQRRWEPGSLVPVYYDAKNPASIFIRDPFDIWFPPAIITVAGVLALLTTSLVLMLLQVQAKKNADEVAAIVAKHISKKQ
ncbi:MAG TPA: DUF3592 domain-containing protein [Prosthecobacter sp.]